jgi:hypothetical protein
MECILRIQVKYFLRYAMHSVVEAQMYRFSSIPSTLSCFQIPDAVADAPISIPYGRMLSLHRLPEIIRVEVF